MTRRQNTWLLRDESLQQPHGAVRADLVTEVATLQAGERHLFMVELDGGRCARLGSCPGEYRDRMMTGLLSALAQADESQAHFVVIKAIPESQQDGPDANFWSFHENKVPDSAPGWAALVVPAQR
jgi:hypothetical protein